jgi:ATP/maltotriose-dependent transcriptional regulator MalT
MRPNAVGTTIPATVFLPPGLPPALVERRRLEEQLGRPGASKLSVVVGAAGAGKTTLVRAWLRGAEHTWAWVTLDEPDSGADRFWRLLIGAVQVARPGLILDASDLIASNAFDEVEVADTLVGDLVDAGLAGEPLVVVIDDAHFLSDDGWSHVSWLLQYQPVGLHLVLASRSDPPFSLARLQAAGTVSVVRQAQLSFDPSETRDLFASVLGDDIETTELADALHERTEGWAAGLRLALLALQSGADGRELDSRVAGWRGTIAELLVNEVLDHQPPEIRHFLRCTSVAAMLDPELCDALTEQTDSRVLLRRLAADHVFLSPVEDIADHYRYHPLLAQLLRFEVHAEEPDLEVELHRRAAHWYEDRGSPIDAIEHLVAAGDLHAAFELVLANVARLHREARRAQVAAWLAAVPEDYVVADPDRAVSLCGILLLTARREWFSWWQRCDQMVDDRPDLRRRLDVFRAVGHGTQGRSDEFFDIVRRLRPSPNDPFDEILSFWHAELLSLDGAHDEAIAVASALVAAPRVLIRDAPALSILARTLHNAGEHERARASAERAVRMWQDLGEPDLLGMVDALVLRARALCEAGDLDAAEELAELAFALCDTPPPHLLTIRAALALSAVDDARGESERARRRLIDVAEDARLAGVDARLLAMIDDRLGTSSGSLQPVNQSPRAVPSQVDDLTHRELTILPLLRSHLTFPEIAQELYISRYTVKTHVSRIYRKLGVSSRSAAIREAERRGLLN